MNTSKVSVSNISIKDVRPKLKNQAFAKYLPTRLFPEFVEFQLSGVNNAISNAIRRTVSCELLVSSMYVKYEDISTSDMFNLAEIIMKRFKMIPIDQKTPLTSTFELDVTNSTADVIDVKSGSIRIKNSPLNKLPFNETFTLFTLNPGKSIKIKHISIHQSYGFSEREGMCVMAYNAASIPLDQIPINLYEPELGGIPSSISNPKVYKITFRTNGTLPGKEIVRLTCDSIISRIHSVKELLSTIDSNGDEYSLSIVGESDTIGNLFMKTIVTLYPDIRAVVYHVPSNERICNIRVRCDEDINVIFTNAIKHMIDVFTTIKGYFH